MKNKIRQFDRVKEISTGRKGAVCHVWKSGDAYEVEFFTKSGNTTGLFTLFKDEVVKEWDFKTRKDIK